ncbi:sodium/alanine symporter domain protein [Vibrio cholerae O1 str. EM-1676A]|nr:sodium/alanine symporter domain protein [Vibrio cholerae O1 str. EM-1676A]
MERGDASVIRFTAIFEDGKSVGEMAELDKTQSQSEVDTDPDQ